MIRSLKTLGLLVVAALALSAVAASGAQAGEYTSGLTDNGLGEVEHTQAHFHGVQEGTNATENYFEANGVKVSCPNAQVMLTGTTGSTGTSTSLTVTPNYEGSCGTIKETEPNKDSVNKLVTINMEGCDYKFNQPTELAANEYTATINLECPTGKSPIVTLWANEAHTIKLCEITIEPNQAGLQHAILHNENNRPTGPDHVTAEVDVEEEIQYTNKTATCPGGITEAGKPKADGSFTSNVTVTSVEEGTTNPAEDDLWISGK